MEKITDFLKEGRRRFGDKTYIQDHFSDELNLYLLGERVGDGAEHRVYEYGEEKVVKVPRVNMLYGHFAGEIYENYDICRKYFPDFLLESEILHDEDGHYIMIQRKLNNPRNFSVHDLENDELREQFEEIVESNRKMVEEGLGTYDFFGMKGVIESYLDNLKFNNKGAELSNILVEEQEDGTERIVLSEFDLIKYRDNSKSLKDSLISNISFLAQRYSLKKFFGYDLGKTRKRKAK
ncbi:hypothetical protein GF362_06940 [Candidatus Dojkabacteria bacterium]|nr:hypothetical protein [Candidatus Dojkabacteria bacterium]